MLFYYGPSDLVCQTLKAFLFYTIASNHLFLGIQLYELNYLTLNILSKRIAFFAVLPSVELLVSTDKIKGLYKPLRLSVFLSTTFGYDGV